MSGETRAVSPLPSRYAAVNAEHFHDLLWGVFPHAPSEQSVLQQTPARVLQVSSDTVCLEIGSDPAGRGLSPTRPPTFLAVTSLGLRNFCLALCWGSHGPSLGWIDFLEQLTELGETRLPVYDKGVTKMRRHTGKVWRGPKHRSFCLCAVGPHQPPSACVSSR